MFRFFSFLLLTVAVSINLAWAQSNLPPCPTEKSASYDNCYGQVTMPNREKYVGEFKDGKKNGRGTLTSSNGDKWVGEFTANELNGQATFTSRDGTKYVGGYRNGEKHGQGTYTWPNGDKFFGEFRYGETSQGTLIRPNGDKWIGEFGANGPNGQVTFTSHDGIKYIGGYLNGEKHGQGKYIWASGDKYFGEFRNGHQEGEGVLLTPDGSLIRSGIWKKGKFIKSTNADPALLALARGDNLPVSTALSSYQQVQNNSIRTPPFTQQASIIADTSRRRVALLIANSNYSSVPLLPNPINDANLLANSLKASGFQKVIVKSDQTHEALLSSIKEFAKEADGSDWAFIYYSGHGIAFNGINYIIPVDARLKADRDIQLESVDVNAVVAALDGAKKIRVVVLDMCRSNPFVGGMRRAVASRSIGRGLAPIEPEAGVLTVFAAKDGQEALDGEGSNSPFAEALAKRILTPNLEIRRLFDLVRDDVLANTQRKQQPFSYGSVSGSEDFYFVQK